MQIHSNQRQSMLLQSTTKRRLHSSRTQQWVKANVRFYSVPEKVEPFRARNDKYANEIQQRRGTLYQLCDKKAVVDKKVAQFHKRSTTAQERSFNSRTEQIFSKVKYERGRWNQQQNGITVALASFPKEILLASAVA